MSTGISDIIASLDLRRDQFLHYSETDFYSSMMRDWMSHEVSEREKVGSLKRKSELLEHKVLEVREIEKVLKRCNFKQSKDSPRKEV